LSIFAPISEKNSYLFLGKT